MPDPLLTIEGRVRRLVSGNMRRRAPAADIHRAVSDLLDREGITTGTGDGHFRLNLEAEAARQHDWVRSHTMSPEERRMSAMLLGRAGQDYARMGDRIQHDILAAVDRGLRQDLSTRDIENAVAHAVRRQRATARTITRTALGGFDRANVVRQVVATGARRLRLVGPPGERPWCASRVGLIYTLDEIRAMNNGQGLSVLLYCGGYNCRHHWVIALASDRNILPDTRSPLAQAWFNGSVVINCPAPVRAEMDDITLRFLNRHLDDEDIARITGAPDGAEIYVAPSAADDTVAFYVRHPLYQSDSIRTMRFGGVNELHQDLLIIQPDAPSGFGTHVFATQIEAARDLDLDIVTVFAAGSITQTQWAGYYVWPRLGYDAPVPFGVRHRLPEALADVETLSDLYNTAEGRAFWKRHGHGMDMVFELWGDSYDRLQAYLVEKGIKLK